MKMGVLAIAVGLLLGSAGWSAAEVNCKQVNKYLSTGRSVEDVAQTMVIDEKEVKKCQEAATEQKGAGGGEAKGGEAGQPGMAK